MILLMASSNILLLVVTSLVITITLLLFPMLVVAQDIIVTTTPPDDDDVPLNIQIPPLQESNIQEKIHGLKSKDESIKWMDDNIRKRSAIIASLQSDILSVYMKGSLEAMEQLHKAQARIDELETLVANLRKQTNKLRKKLDKSESLAHKKYSYLNSTLETLMRINYEQKTILLKSEYDRQMTKGEMMKANMRETELFRELIEVQGSWFPYWLSVRLLNYQKSVELHIGKLEKLADPHLQEVKKFIKPCVDPILTVITYHVDNAQILMKPYKKKLQTSIREFTANDELAEALKIFLFLVFALMALLLIFRRNPELRRCNSHENVAKGDQYVHKTNSGYYNGEITQKGKMKSVTKKRDEGKKKQL